MNKVSSILFLLLLLIHFRQINCQGAGAEVQLLSIPEGLTGTVKTTVYQDSIGFLWIGTETGLIKYDGYNLHWFRNLPSDTGSISDNFVHAICEGTAGDLWIGTNKGISRLDRRTALFNNYTTGRNENTILCEEPVYGICSDTAGIIWANSGSILQRFDPRTGICKHFSIYPEMEVRDTHKIINLPLLIDSCGALWCGLADGLYVFNTSFEHGRYFPGPKINSLCQDRNGLLWMATATGLYNFRNDSLLNYPFGLPVTHFPPDQQCLLYEDRNENIFIATTEGCYKYDFVWNEYLPVSGRILADDDQQPVELNFMITDKSEILWLATSAGLYRVNKEKYISHPDSVTANSFMPNVAFTSFELSGKNGKLVMPLDKALKIIVPRGNQLFSIHFSALDYTRPEKNRYMYLMVRNGHEGSWVDIGNQHYVTFFNLPSGSYSFTVRGSNSDGVWNEQGSTLEVVVLTPRYASLGAFILYGFLALLLVYLVVQVQTRNLRRSNRILQEKEMNAREVARQREELMIKNKNITDSITYAQRIQFALLPTEEQFSSILPESFILYKPKDIVSGDFYWITENPRKIYVAAIDCTGHGVPGAFMSIIGFELFRNITGVQGEPNPARILDSLNDNYAEIFSDGEHVYLKDGMDVALCVFDKEERSLEFSGACNPLYLIRDETIIEIRADRSSIGAEIIQVPTENRKFKSHKLFLQENDIMYIFSDGYADQFGGPEGKKFKYRRFRHLLLTIHKLSMQKQRSILEASMEEWKRGLDQVDDILVIGIRPVFGKKRT